MDCTSKLNPLMNSIDFNNAITKEILTHMSIYLPLARGLCNKNINIFLEGTGHLKGKAMS